MHTISIFVDQNRMPKLVSYFECQTHLAKKLRNSANFILRNLRTGLKKDPVDRTSNENEVIKTVRIGIEMANEKLQKDVDRLTKQLQSLPASDPARTKIQKRIDNKQKNHPIMPTSDHWMLTYETLDAVMKNTKNPDVVPVASFFTTLSLLYCNSCCLPSSAWVSSSASVAVRVAYFSSRI